jgi:hypothetical protein
MEEIASIRATAKWMSFRRRVALAAWLREVATEIEAPRRVQWLRFDDTTKSLVAYVPGEMRRPPECDPEGRIGEAEERRRDDPTTTEVPTME